MSCVCACRVCFVICVVFVRFSSFLFLHLVFLSLSVRLLSVSISITVFVYPSLMSAYLSCPSPPSPLCLRGLAWLHVFFTGASRLTFPSRDTAPNPPPLPFTLSPCSFLGVFFLPLLFLCVLPFFCCLPACLPGSVCSVVFFFPSVRPSFRWSSCPSFRSCFRRYFHPSFHRYFRLSVCLSVRLFVDLFRVSVFPSVYVLPRSCRSFRPSAFLAPLPPVTRSLARRKGGFGRSCGSPRRGSGRPRFRRPCILRGRGIRYRQRVQHGKPHPQRRSR